MTNFKSNDVILVPGCLLCPAFQAVRSEKNLEWSKKMIPYLLENNMGIIPMPCPEVSFGGLRNGMARGPHGVDYYEKLSGFEEHCERLREMVVNQISELSEAGFRVVAIVGIEHSPTCAANYMYTHQGTVKRQGIFMQEVSDGLKQRNLVIPIMGINRCHPDKFLRDLKQLLESGC